MWDEGLHCCRMDLEQLHSLQDPTVRDPCTVPREAEPVLSTWGELGAAGQQGAAKGWIISENWEFWGCSRCHGSSATKASLDFFNGDLKSDPE